MPARFALRLTLLLDSALLGLVLFVTLLGSFGYSLGSCGLWLLLVGFAVASRLGFSVRLLGSTARIGRSAQS